MGLEEALPDRPLFEDELDELASGHAIAAITAYITTKYLPPLTVKAFITILVVGFVWAGIRWYWRVPRR